MLVQPVTSRMPGPRQLPLGWQLHGIRLLQGPLSFLSTTERRYGEISSTSPGRPKHVFVFGPRYHRELLGNPDLFIADAFRELRMSPRSAMARLTAGLLKLNGEPHRRHRNLMQPAFHSRAVQRHHDAIVEITQQELDRFQFGEVRRIDHDLSRLMLRVGMRTLFDISATDDVDRLNAQISRLLASATAPTTLLFPLNLPGTSYRRTQRAADQLDAALRAIITAKRADPGSDVISMLIATRDEQGCGLTEDELIGEAYTAFCHDSIASTLTWILFLLDQHPEVRTELVAELDAALGGDPPAPGAVDGLPLLDRVIKESLRLFPPASMGLRYAAEDCQLGPYDVPRDATVFFSAYVSHRLAEVFAEPLRFWPDRWLDAHPDSFGYLPFGAGPHSCLGRPFALLEMKIVLSILLQRFRLPVVDGTRVDGTIKISLVPADGLPVIVQRPAQDRRSAVVTGTVREAVNLS